MRYFRTIAVSLLILFALSAVSMPAEANNMSGVKVLGKALIKAGIPVLVVIEGRIAVGESYEDQELYIVELIYNKSGKLVGYMLDGQGFKHRCDVHGLEIYNTEDIFIGISVRQVNAGHVKINLF